MMEDISDLLQRGNFSSALELALRIEDPFSRLEALSYIYQYVEESEYREAVLGRMLEIVDSFEGLLEKARALALIAYTLAVTGDKKGEYFFKKAHQAIKAIDHSLWKAEGYDYLAYYMALAGKYNDALYYYNIAYETAQKSPEPYSRVLSFLYRLAQQILESAERIHSPEAKEFYELAAEIYEDIKRHLSAQELKKKASLIEMALEKGSRLVSEFLERRDVDNAVFVIKYLPDEEKLLALLEIAYWLFLHDKKGLAKSIVEDAFRMAAERKIRPNDEKLEEIALKFLKIGEIGEALTVGAIISDDRIASRVFEKIALTYAKRGEKLKAITVAEAISDENIKRDVLKAIEGEENVGHE
ncbi:hypothetical protein ADU37_CDS13950 [Thermococcus sp. 2319x1]|uniref:hypothetical protein n=1 Tax=Thermococcus sp. 2319x1 TaxID=1674923 RepID=UPI00073AA8FF|nr:hypothetical protein [Thermococcus sp. 2319x1]ALV63094.1 hypothetical protein ADU37_CDS13950 [Thermococcus sp. 2319x1]